MSGEVVSMGCEMPASHFIDEDQAENQVEATAAHLRAEAARGRQAPGHQKLLDRARELLREGHFTKAFLLAIRARGIDLERVGP
jgi:hypothetical protein